jgi:hypothetical protein
MDIETNWDYLAQAVEYYKHSGFTYVELPYVASHSAIMATCPKEEFVVKSDIGALVGSAEQAFIERDLAGDLPKGRYVACTPCFRQEPHVDDLHKKSFMKVELYVSDVTNDSSLQWLIDQCLFKFEDLVSKKRIPINELKVVETPEGFDIELGGIEIGSYGIRSHGNLKWVYGTGIAEPRFSTALRKLDHLVSTDSSHWDS